jgi:hypothetical protein
MCPRNVVRFWPTVAGVARLRRIAPEGTLQHVVSRFVSREFRLHGREERDEWLARASEVLSRTDWRLLGFALMSSHVHLALLAGAAPPCELFKALNCGFAGWLNRRQSRTGPVFEGRYFNVTIPPARTGPLLAYLHNNPVRAGCSPTAAASEWTSHRMYLGLAPPVDGLDVGLGLELAGFSDSAEGRRGFAHLVAERSGDPRDPDLSGRDIDRRRARVRCDLGAPVEVGSPRLGARGLMLPPRPRPHTPLRPRWDGDLAVLLRAVARVTRTPASSLSGRSRQRGIVQSRRLFMLCGSRHLGRTQVELAAVIGISSGAASRLLADRARCEHLDARAAAVAARLRAGEKSESKHRPPRGTCRPGCRGPRRRSGCRRSRAD